MGERKTKYKWTESIKEAAVLNLHYLSRALNDRAFWVTIG